MGNNNTEKLLLLIKTGTKENINLAFKLAKSQYIDLENITREYFALNWIEKQNFSLSEKILPKKKIQTKLFHLLNMEELLFRGVTTTFPEELKNLPFLRTLSFYFCNIQVIPSYIKHFSLLMALEFYNCNLQEVCKEIGELSNLEYLNLEANQLTEIPNELGKLNNLEQLNLEENKLQKIPITIGNLKKLEILMIEKNNIKFLPKEIETLPSLIIENLTYDKSIKMSDNFRAQATYYDYYDDCFE